MNILYVSCTCSREKFIQYVESKGARGSQQAQKYNLLLAEGLQKNGANVTVISSRPINRMLERRFWIKSEHECVNGVEFRYLPFVNYPILRNLWILVGTFLNILFSGCKKKDTAIVCDALNVASAIGTISAAALRGFQTVGIVTDVPGCSYSMTTSLGGRINLWIMRKFKSYLLLTQPMTNLVNPENRPYIVLEGHADQGMAEVNNTLDGKHKKKVVLYAGSLMEIYGIGNLVEGFIKAQIPNSELHIYGDGNYVEKLKRQVAEHKNVSYMGIAPNDEIVREELAATLLVNPRPTSEEYTKYSFPSKNMEYMASGTPLLTTKLPGMPEDYYPYVYLLEDETVEGMMQALKKILSNDSAVLAEKGMKAKLFVLEHKGNVAQARKLLDMLERNLTH